MTTVQDVKHVQLSKIDSSSRTMRITQKAFERNGWPRMRKLFLTD